VHSVKRFISVSPLLESKRGGSDSSVNVTSDAADEVFEKSESQFFVVFCVGLNIA
jgi:hypothetical protein